MFRNWKKKNNWKAIFSEMCGDGHGATRKDIDRLSSRYSYLKKKQGLKEIKESGIFYDKHKLTAVQIDEICK